jgi:hypothetical protein
MPAAVAKRLADDVGAPAAESDSRRWVAVRTKTAIRQITILWPACACFAASRLVVFLTLYVEPVLKPGFRRLSFFSDWDAGVYLRIARSGYPQLHSPGGGFDATAAFFPLLPLLIRGVHDVTRLSFRASGIAVAHASGLAAFCVIWLVFREFVGERDATTGLPFGRRASC